MFSDYPAWKMLSWELLIGSLPEEPAQLRQPAPGVCGGVGDYVGQPLPAPTTTSLLASWRPGKEIKFRPDYFPTTYFPYLCLGLPVLIW